MKLLRGQFAFCVLLTATLFCEPALAYIGPGIGVSIFGALIGVLSMAALAVWATSKWLVTSLFRGRRPSAAGMSDAQGPVDAPSQTTGERRSGYLTIPFLIVFVIGVIGWLDAPRDYLRSVASGFSHLGVILEDPLIEHHTSAARFDADSQGVVIHDPDRAFSGYNIELSASSDEARLMDMNGREVHRWAADLAGIERAWAAAGTPLTDLSATYWRRAKPLPDGSLLIILESPRTTPYAQGMIKIDWNSNLVWALPRLYHHSIDTDPSGRIYTLYQDIAESDPIFDGAIETPFLNEGVAILSPDGTEIERIDILQALANSPYASLISRILITDKPEDPLHLNTVRYITADIASKLPFADAGDLIVSARNIDTVLIVEPETKRIKWMASNHWVRQHDPVFTADGTLVVFDNIDIQSGGSRIVEWDPNTGQFERILKGPEDRPISSERYGAVSVLPNGNLMVSSSFGGRALEMTPDGETVWEWRTDRRFGDHQERVANLMEIIRVPVGFFDRSIVKTAGLSNTAGQSK